MPKWQRKLGAPKPKESFEELYDRARTLERHDQQYSLQQKGMILKELRTNLYVVSPRVNLKLASMRKSLLKTTLLFRIELFVITVGGLGTWQGSPRRSLRLLEGLASLMS